MTVEELLSHNSVRSLLRSPYVRRTMVEKLNVKKLGPDKSEINLTQRTNEKAKSHSRPLAGAGSSVENRVGGAAAYRRRVGQHLAPCLGQMCLALNDDALWRNLNQLLLLKTRSPQPQVRFSALLLVLELASRLKENYVVLLPDTVPYLAELMEDECEEVEQQVQKVVQEMENILGEPLQGYF